MKKKKDGHDTHSLPYCKAQCLGRLPLFLSLQQCLRLFSHALSLVSVHKGICQSASLLGVLVVVLLALVECLLVPVGVQLFLGRQLGEHKWLLKFDRHLLDGTRAEPALDLHLGSVGLALGDFLLFNVGADADDADIVGMEEVVAKVELVHVEGHNEFGEVGRHARCPDEGHCEIGPVAWLSVLF